MPELLYFGLIYLQSSNTAVQYCGRPVLAVSLLACSACHDLMLPDVPLEDAVQCFPKPWVPRLVLPLWGPIPPLHPTPFHLGVIACVLVRSGCAAGTVFSSWVVCLCLTYPAGGSSVSNWKTNNSTILELKFSLGCEQAGQ